MLKTYRYGKRFRMTAYKAAMVERIEELLPLVDDDLPLSDKILLN